MSLSLKKYLTALPNNRAKSFLKKALSLGAKIEVLSEKFKILKITYQNKTKFLLKENLFLNKKPGTLFTKNKEITKILLRDAAIHIPFGIHAKSYAEALSLMKKSNLNYPVVVKPIDAAKGLGVTVGVTDDNELKKSIEKINACLKNSDMKCSGDFLVEKIAPGKDFRVLVVKNKVAACAERVPAYIIGDGKTALKQLVDKFNKKRPNNYSIVIDNELKKVLAEKRLTLETILKNKEKVVLRKNANISSGGRAFDRTKNISPRFKNIAIKASAVLGLNYSGVDIMTEDISSNNPSQEYFVIEINGAPDYDIHEKPVIIGKGVDVSKILFEEFMKK